MILELDQLSAAGAAVNAIVWDLGPRAVVGSGDVLARADLEQDAFARRRELFGHRDWLSELTGFALATHTADQLLRELTTRR